MPVGGGQGTTVDYVWCGDRPCQARSSGNLVLRAYYAEGEYAPGSPPTASYYAPDRLGSVRRVFTASTSGPTDFDPYGQPLTATPATDYGYAETITNPDSGLYLTPARAYDPVTGRWISRDPAGEAADPYGNLYAYAAGNPVDYVDPQGTFLAGAVVGGLEGAFFGAVSAYETGGDAGAVAVGALFGGLGGLAVGAVDPTEGIGTTIAISGLASGAGDVATQLVQNGGNFGNINYESTLGAVAAGAIGGAVGFAPAGAAARRLIPSALDFLTQAITNAATAFLPKIGAEVAPLLNCQ